MPPNLTCAAELLTTVSPKAQQYSALARVQRSCQRGEKEVEPNLIKPETLTLQTRRGLSSGDGALASKVQDNFGGYASVLQAQASENWRLLG